MSDDLDDALAQVRRELAHARAELEATKSPELEALKARLATLQRATAEGAARAAELEQQLATARAEALQLEARLDA